MFYLAFHQPPDVIQNIMLKRILCSCFIYFSFRHAMFGCFLISEHKCSYIHVQDIISDRLSSEFAQPSFEI